ncbi:hypothetical protein ACXET9_13980 [Brachybacterium sp. DNPG3]
MDPIEDALGAALGTERAEQLLTTFDAHTNQPNAVKGAAKRPSDPELEATLLRVITAASPQDLDEALDSIAMWGLLALAARADATVLDDLPEGRSASPKVATIRRSAARHRKALAVASMRPAADVAELTVRGVTPPAKVSEVAAWLTTHSDPDPAVLAPTTGQRATARRAALRALGTLATPAALAVLAQYATDRHTDADLAELYRAWARFDRREFAAAMFGPAAADLRLGGCSTIEGIGAVEGLRGLSVILDEQADLAPLAECTDLRRLQILATVDSGLTSISPITRLLHLTDLELTGTTRGADLSQLADTPVERMTLALDGAEGSFLAEMPRLRWLALSGEREEDPALGSRIASDPSSADPALTGVILTIVRRGVTVVLHQHEGWVPAFMANAPRDITVDTINGSPRLRLAR